MARVAGILMFVAAMAWVAFLATTAFPPEAPRAVAPAIKPSRLQPFVVPLREGEFARLHSCSAAACHGAAPSGADPSWHAAFAVWMAHDPHASAHVVLASERSCRMVEALARWRNAHPQTIVVEHCAGCHATETPALAVYAPAHGRTLAGALRCEVCHGEPTNWLVEHTAPAWKALSPDEKAARGFLDTEDPVTRARICASCHVGSVGRDVNHDLIAAGHPRLNFEFSAYWDALPRHWNSATERHRSQERLNLPETASAADLTAGMWMEGQLATAQAALELLRTRAERATSSHGAFDRTVAPWPEFAEYACFGCHRELPPPSTKPRLLGADPAPPGALVWGSWHYAAPWLLSNASNTTFPALHALRAKMTDLSCDASHVVELVPQAQEELERWRQQGWPWRRDQLLKQLGSEAVSPAAMDWDTAAQWLLAARALGRDRALDEKLGRLHRTLAFPSSAASPDEGTIVYRSPRGFHPTDENIEFLRAFEEVRAALRSAER